jgi:hypothetical protein
MSAAQPPPPTEGDAPRTMTLPERNELIRAANRARIVYPGAVGELIHRELEAAQNFGYLLVNGSLLRRLVAQVMEADGPPAY